MCSKNARTFATSILVALCLFFWSAAGALANGVPVKVFLNYLPDVSTWGPETASGEAVLAVGEGWATVSVHGLPRLQGEVYVAWVIPKQGAAIPIGKFNTDDAGTGDFEIRGLSLPQKPYKLLLLTVEGDSARYLAPGNRRSIAGRFPDPELRAAPPSVPTPVPGTPGTGASGDGRGDGTQSGDGAQPQPNGHPAHGRAGPDTETTSSLARPVPTRPVPQMLPVTGGVSGPDRWAVWLMAYGVWLIAYGVWRWRMADGGWRMADGGWRIADLHFVDGQWFT